LIIFHSYSHVFSHVFRKTLHASPAFPTISGLRSGGSPEHRRSRQTSLPEIMMWGVPAKWGVPQIWSNMDGLSWKIIKWINVDDLDCFSCHSWMGL
jgi:hypothetical protein